MITFIVDSPKGRKYKFSTKDEESKFRAYWGMGLITDPYNQNNKPLKK